MALQDVKKIIGNKIKRRHWDIDITRCQKSLR